MKLSAYIHFILILFTTCERFEEIGPNTIPAPLNFVLVDANNENIIESANQRLKIYFYDNNDKEYISDLVISEFEYEYKYMLSTRIVNIKSGDNGIKNFYLEFESGDIDTIFSDVERLDKPANNEYYRYIQVKFNNKEVERDINTIPPVYIFKK